MDNNELKIALRNIDKLLTDDVLCYSPYANKFCVSHYAGMGTTEVNELPNEYQDLVINYELDEGERNQWVIAKLSMLNRATDEIKPYADTIARVSSIQLYGHEHEANLMSAIRFASIHHSKQKRKSTGEPYINDLIEVAQLIKFYEPSSEETTLIAAVLHDILEDTQVSIESIDFLFGPEVSSLVSVLTCVASNNSEDKKKRLLDQISEGSNRAKVIKLADVISNMISLPSHWSIVQKEKYVAWCQEIALVCAPASANLFERFQRIKNSNEIII